MRIIQHLTSTPTHHLQSIFEGPCHRPLHVLVDVPPLHDTYDIFWNLNHKFIILYYNNKVMYLCVGYVKPNYVYLNTAFENITQ